MDFQYFYSGMLYILGVILNTGSWVAIISVALYFIVSLVTKSLNKPLLKKLAIILAIAVLCLFGSAQLGRFA